MRSGSPPPLLPGLTRHLAKIALVGGLLCAFAMPAAAAPKAELRELRSRIQSLQKKLDSTQASRTEAADALKQSERAISDINRRLHGLDQQQNGVRQALGRLQQQRGRTRQDIEAQQTRLGALLYQQYLHPEGDYLSLLLNRQDPNRIARELQYYGYISRARAALITELGRNLRQLQGLTDDTRRKDDELARIRNQQAEQKVKLQQQQDSRKEALARLSRQVDSQRQQIGRLQRNEKRLTALVERLGRLAAKKRPRSGLHNRQLPEASLSGISFPRLKGKLHLPVVGELVSRFGSPRQDTGIPWKGLFIRARAGQPVKAIASGRVVFADWLRGFGNLLILDHGDGYMSLYADNESLYKQVGDEVRAGDTIATVGNSGGNLESGLYFELRYQSKPFDPLTWMTLK